MAHPELKTLDDYEAFLVERMTGWSPSQRIALAASIAECWLPAYVAFSAEESWGDPAAIGRSLEAVWGQVQGRLLTESDVARHIQHVDEITPHMDDFDAMPALIACVVLSDALRACGGPDQTLAFALRAVLGVFDGLVEDWPIDPAAQSRVWQKSAVRKELQTQLKVLTEIEATTTFNAKTIQQLRDRLAPLKVKPARRPKPKGPPALSNQTLFEQYRKMVESDLKQQVALPEPSGSAFLVSMRYLAPWLSRYSRRFQSLNGSYGRPSDLLGIHAVFARNRFRDAAATGHLAWEPAVREVLELCMKNNAMMKVLDANSIETSHAYGPSLRQLWLEGSRTGASDADGWTHIRTWAGHRPTAWEREDRRKKKGKIHAVPELGQTLARKLEWRSTTDANHPWETEIDGIACRVRVNDFPDEVMYTLLLGSEHVGDFHDWPETWQRSVG